MREERDRLMESLKLTVNHVARLERLLGFLTPEEQLIIDRMLINPNSLLLASQSTPLSRICLIREDVIRLATFDEEFSPTLIATAAQSNV